ncbi:MAG: S8 family serine peptidase [Acidobacteria bacterium]|nr:S8 family serine peptidase [Acidobacteriota bacterium]
MHTFKIPGSAPASRSRRGVGPLLVTLVLAGVFVVVWSADARAQALSAQLVQQFNALAALKASRTPVQQKIDSNLLLENDRRQGLTGVDALGTVNSGVDVDAGGTVLVDIETQVTPGLLTAIAAVGGTVVNSYAQYDAVRARIPIGQLEAIAARGEVRFVGPAARAYTNQRLAISDPGPITNAGPTSEGDVAHQADLARSMHSVDGSGVTVGVLSDSVDALAAMQASGDLPGTCPQVSGPCVTVLAGQSGNPGTSEGTAMMEIVHDLAPGADIFFATAFAGQASFASNIQALQAAGADVIVDDVSYYATPVFQDGIIAQAVDTVAALGVPYFSSAGNSGNKNDGTAGVFEGTYVPGSAAVNDYSSCHNFGAGPSSVANRITKNSTIYTLHWAEPQGAAMTDYDLFLVNPAFNLILASSTGPQSGTQNPFEWFQSTLNDFNSYLVVCLWSGSPSTTNRYIHLNTNRGQLAVSTIGQTSGQSAAVGAFSVAAVDASPPAGPRMPFDGTEPVETFSSDGPRRIFFEANGTPLGSPVDRQKPDIAAADGVTTATPGFNPFFGTSAAAPHAAAIAALMQDAAGGPSSITPAQIRTAFNSTSLDIEAVGVDRDSGVGIVDALAAVGAVATVSVPFTDPVLTGGVTFVRKVHIDELRTRIDALRVGEGLGNYSFTDPTLVAGATQVKALHILELRQALQDVFVARMEVEPTYTDPAGLVGITIRAAHIQELRDAVVGLE